MQIIRKNDSLNQEKFGSKFRRNLVVPLPPPQTLPRLRQWLPGTADIRTQGRSYWTLPR